MYETNAKSLVVNGETVSVPADWTLLDALRARGVEPTTRGLAVAVGDTVIPRSLWAETGLNEGDRIEVVTAVQGG